MCERILIGGKLKNKIVLGLVGLSFSVVASQSSWIDVERSVYKAEFRNIAWYSEMAPDGTMYLAGWASIKGEGHWLIKRSDDNGNNWKVVLDEKYFAARGFAVSTNSAGHLVAGAELKDAADRPAYGELRVSTDRGETWTKIKDEALDPNKKSIIYHSELLNDGTILTFGSAYDSKDVPHWLIKRRKANTNAWEIVDDMPSTNPNPPNGPFEGPHDSTAAPAAVDPHNQNHILAAGWWDDSTGHPLWVVKQSTDGGSSWTLVDFVSRDYADYFGLPYQVFFDHEGNGYVAGHIVDRNDSSFMRSTCMLRRMDGKTNKWSDALVIKDERSCAILGAHAADDGIYLTVNNAEMADGKRLAKASVMRSKDGGKTWELLIIDDAGPYQKGAQYNGVRANARGEIIVTGTYFNSPLGDEWVVKKFDPKKQ